MRAACTSTSNVNDRVLYKNALRYESSSLYFKFETESFFIRIDDLWQWVYVAIFFVSKSQALNF